MATKLTCNKIEAMTDMLRQAILKLAIAVFGRREIKKKKSQLGVEVTEQEVEERFQGKQQQAKQPPKQVSSKLEATSTRVYKS